MYCCHQPSHTKLLMMPSQVQKQEEEFLKSPRGDVRSVKRVLDFNEDTHDALEVGRQYT